MSNVSTASATTQPMVNTAGFYQDLLIRLSRVGKFPEHARVIGDYVAAHFADCPGDLHHIELQLRLHGIAYEDRDLLKSYYGLSVVGIVPEHQLVKNAKCANANILRQKVGEALDRIVAKDQLVSELSAIHPELWEK